MASIIEKGFWTDDETFYFKEVIQYKETGNVYAFSDRINWLSERIMDQPKDVWMPGSGASIVPIQLCF